MKFHHIVTLFIHFLKILGLAPFSQQTKKSRRVLNSEIFSSSTIGLIYNFLLFVILQVVAASKFPIWISANYSYNSSFIEAIDLVLRIIGFFTTDAIIIHWAIRQKNAIRLLNKLSEIDRLLSTLECQPFLNKRMFIVLGFHIIFNLFLWITLTATDTVSIFASFLEWVVLLLPLFIIYCFIIEYFMIVKLVQNELERANNNLLKIRGLPKYLLRTPFFNDYLTVLSPSSDSQLAALQLLTIVRTMLSEVSEDIVEFFSSPILLAIASMSCVFLCSVFNLIVYCIIPSGATISVVVNLIACITVAVYPLALLSLTVTKAINEAKRTGRIVHKLLTTATKRQIQSELEQFSLQLLHDNFNFTAHGLFTLDCTMLSSIFGTAVTYIVILIQFQQFDNTSKGHTSPEN